MHNKNKKGQLEISFNWIFILIAGAAILFFFIFIILKETTGAEKEININLQKRMESLLSAIEKNPSSIKAVGYFASELRFDCEEGIHEFYVKESIKRAELESELIYAPERIGKSNIIAWTIPLMAPYKISNVLLISDTKTMYVFDNDLPTQIINKFPVQFSMKNLSVNLIKNMQDTGHEKYIIILSQNNFNGFNLITPALKQKGKTTVIVLPSTLDSNVNPKGKIEYYEYSQGISSISLTKTGESYFITFPLLYGAIISGNPSLYNCTTNKIINRMRIVDELNEKRINKLKSAFSQYQSPDSRAMCSIIYLSIINNIQVKRQALNNFHSQNSINEIQTQINNIISADLQLLINSCPQIGAYQGSQSLTTSNPTPAS